LSIFVGRTQTAHEAVNNCVNFHGFSGASIGIYAVDLSTQKIVMHYQSERLLTPASTVKLFSTAFALNNLGASYQPITSLYYNGSIQDSILWGDIWIVGGGDMSLGSSDNGAFLSEWTTSIRSAGIRQINGNIYADGSNFGYQGVPQDWQWGDIGNYYGAHFSGLMLYKNTVEYHFKTEIAGRPAQLLYTVPQIDSLEFTNHIVASTKKGDNSIIFGSPYAYQREGRGTLPENSPDFVVKGSMPHPEQQLLFEFKRQLIADGLLHSGEMHSTKEFTGKQPSATWIKITDYYGKTVFQLATLTNYHSINVFAEGLMRLTAWVRFNKMHHNEACELMQSYWRNKLNSTALFLSDGSGLARTNAVSAKTLCDLLAYMYPNNFMTTLPIAGVSGTLRNIAKNQAAHNKIYAKSGSMRRVKAYAGYANHASGKDIAFAFVINNYTCTNKEATQQLEKLMNALVH